jgi:tRNA-dihydrouridine synthase
MNETGVDGVWIARGAIGNPFIFREVRALLEERPLPPPPTVAEQRAALEEHLRLTAEVYGADRAGVVMRKVCIRYADLQSAGGRGPPRLHRSPHFPRRGTGPGPLVRRGADWPPVRRVLRGAAAALAE